MSGQILTECSGTVTLHCTALCYSPVMLFCYYSISLCNQLGLGDVINIDTLPIMIAIMRVISQLTAHTYFSFRCK